MSSTKIFKFGFIADIKTVTLALKFPCIVSVFWKRGQKTAQIKQRKEIDKGVVTFNQKLEIQCNMGWDTNTQLFQEKKTKFTVVIFSDKGTKQAGEVHLDVAQLLNTKSRKLLLEKSLQKCPDKNAKLTFQLSGYMKQQIKPDAVSQKSNKSNGQLLPTQNPSTVQPDFKKKRKQPVVIENNQIETVQKQKTTEKLFKEVRTQNNNASSIPVTKQNISKVQLMALDDENKKLKTDLRILKDLQIENESLKKQYDQGQKKACQYLNSKYEQIKLEYTQLKQKLQKLRGLQKHKESLQKQLYQNKDKMAAILNYAVLNRYTELAEQLTNIYSSQD